MFHVFAMAYYHSAALCDCERVLIRCTTWKCTDTMHEMNLYQYYARHACKAASTSAYECWMRHTEMREMLIWTYSRGTANSIRLCGECLMNSRMLSLWSRYFKEKTIRNAVRTFKDMSTSVGECEWGMQDWSEPERMPKSDLFGVCLVKHMPSIVYIFFFEIPTSNG